MPGCEGGQLLRGHLESSRFCIVFVFFYKGLSFVACLRSCAGLLVSVDGQCYPYLSLRARLGLNSAGQPAEELDKCGGGSGDVTVGQASFGIKVEELTDEPAPSETDYRMLASGNSINLSR